MDLPLDLSFSALAGKSTLALRFNIDDRLPVVNPDVIAKVSDLTICRQRLKGLERTVFTVKSQDVYLVAKSEEFAKQLAQAKAQKKTKLSYFKG